jgi:hypothetical protein
MTSNTEAPSPEFVRRVVRSVQPHLNEDSESWRRLTEQCAYWLTHAAALSQPSPSVVAEAVPGCGACPGDGSICRTSCRLREESPPINGEGK